MRKCSPIILYGVLVMGLSFSNGCAFGNKYDFSSVTADISGSGNSSVCIATHDQREYVVSGKKRPDFVGLQRGGYGNPFNVSTKSNKPFADDVTDVIAASLAKKGFKAVPIRVALADRPEAVVEKVIAANADRIIIVTLKDWKSDTYMNVALAYDVTLRVYSGQGKKLGEKNIEGRDNLDEGESSPARYARTAVPMALKKKLEELLNSKEIKNVLQ